MRVLFSGSTRSNVGKFHIAESLCVSVHATCVRTVCAYVLAFCMYCI